MIASDKSFLRTLFQVAVDAADPQSIIADFMPEKPKGRTIVVGAGKGVAQLARAFESNWPYGLEGAVVTRYGFAVPCDRIRVIEAQHPVPDEHSLAAAELMFELVSDLTADDLVVALICGGGSALLTKPQPELALKDKIDLNRALLESGAPIDVLNTIRKQFSAIKGGRLAMRAAPARVVSLIVSDVPGDNPAFVASGPTIPSATTGRDVRDLIDRYKLNLPENILAFLEKSELEPPSPDDTVFAGNETRIIASARQSLEAAADYGRRQNMDVRILSDAIEGESRIVGRQLAEQACQLAVSKVGDRPLLLLSGGETTVTLDAAGKGGPNTEYMLSFALHLESSQEIISLAADTDGIDGSEDNAGAFADQTTRDRMLTAGIDAADCLQRHDSWTAFDRIGDLFVTGPTGTNVNDFRAILIK